MQKNDAIKSIGKRPLENFKQLTTDHESALHFLNEKKAEVNEKINKAGSISLLSPCRLCMFVSLCELSEANFSGESQLKIIWPQLSSSIPAMKNIMARAKNIFLGKGDPLERYIRDEK